MKSYHLEIDSIHGTVAVNILRKSIKNIHLKVLSDLSVNISVPLSVENIYIENLLQSKREWIGKQLLKYKQSQGYNALLDIKSGTSTQYLGKDLRIIKRVFSPQSFITSENVEIDEKSMYIYLKKDSDERFVSLIHSFWRKQAKEIFQRELDNIYHKVFRKYGIEKPSFSIRKMKTLWGSCTQSKNKITLNEYLLKADLLCIQYVILHELTHLMYTYHNKDFYTFITIHMPDWKSRKKRLDKGVVQGL